MSLLQNIVASLRSPWSASESQTTHQGYEVAVNSIPESIRGRVALVEGVLHMSEEIKGNLDMLGLVADLQARGITRRVWHEPGVFDTRYAKMTVTVTAQENDQKQYAVDLIAKAHAKKASDIHLLDNGSYILIRFRVMGLMQDYTPLPVEFGRQLIQCLYTTIAGIQSTPSFSPTENMDARIADRKYLPPDVHAIRVHVAPIECATGKGHNMYLRLLYDSTAASGTLEGRTSRLGFTVAQQAILRSLTNRTGLIIISGPTGHGKSTLLKHGMESMAEEKPQKSYMACEDPPEVPMKGVAQVLVSTNLDRATLDERKRGLAYIEAIAGALRSNPDVLMIGEIRYPEAAAAAVNAALTGHAVFATLHANNAFGIIPRMQSLLNEAGYVEPLEHLCDPNVLAGMVYQRLIPILCPDCKISLGKLIDEGPERRRYHVSDRLFEYLQPIAVNGIDAVFVRGEGCEHCGNEGFVGLQVAAEVIAPDIHMLDLLRSGKSAEAYSYWIKEQKGVSYIGHACQLVADGLADPAETENRLGVPLNFDRR